MSRFENSSIQVSPSREQEAIEVYQKFGWELVSSQEIFNKDSHNEARGDSLYSVTETTNYVKLLFRRDKDMPYYNEVCDLENQYYDKINNEPHYSFSKALLYIGIVIAVIGLFVVITGSIGEKFIGLPILAAGIALIVFKTKKHNKEQAAYDEAKAIWDADCARLISEVENYV